MNRKEPKHEPMLNLKVMRVKKGFTLTALADSTGINYNTISQYENGIHRPRMDNIKAIAEALGCEVQDII